MALLQNRISVLSSRRGAYDALLRWVLFIGLLCVGAVILWDYGFLHYLFVNDKSWISAVIVALFVLFSLHCLYTLVDLSNELRTLEVVAENLEDHEPIRLEDTRLSVGEYTVPTTRAVETYLRDVALKHSKDPRGERDVLVQALAAHLRSRAQPGIFMSDVLYKLGLLGTVIGFILMLSSIGDMGEFDVVTLRGALQGMTSGMAVSLLTTVAGLVCGTLLRMEYAMAEGVISQIVQRAVRITEVFFVPALRGRRDV